MPGGSWMTTALPSSRCRSCGDWQMILNFTTFEVLPLHLMPGSNAPCAGFRSAGCGCSTKSITRGHAETKAHYTYHCWLYRRQKILPAINLTVTRMMAAPFRQAKTPTSYHRYPRNSCASADRRRPKPGEMMPEKGLVPRHCAGRRGRTWSIFDLSVMAGDYFRITTSVIARR